MGLAGAPLEKVSKFLAYRQPALFGMPLITVFLRYAHLMHVYCMLLRY